MTANACSSPRWARRRMARSGCCRDEGGRFTGASARCRAQPGDSLPGRPSPSHRGRGAPARALPLGRVRTPGDDRAQGQRAAHEHRLVRRRGRHLASLAAVAHDGSFGGAAARLGYTPWAISGQITTLERIVGARMLNRLRGARSVELTPERRVLLRHAETISSQLAARHDLASLVHGRREQHPYRDVRDVRAAFPRRDATARARTTTPPSRWRSVVRPTARACCGCSTRERSTWRWRRFRSAAPLSRRASSGRTRSRSGGAAEAPRECEGSLGSRRLPGFRRFSRGGMSRERHAGLRPSGRSPLAGKNGRYWARTSDPQLVELVLSQLS